MRQHEPSNSPDFLRKLVRQRQLVVMALPFIVLTAIFNYGPLWGWVMAFQDYKIAKGIAGSPFIGFGKFAELFRDEQFYLVLRNTLVMSALNLVTSFVGAITLALLLNEVRSAKFKKTIQTITYIPHFVSWVVIANIVMMFLSPDGGMLNELLMGLGLIAEPIYFMAKGEYFWFIHTAANLWKELGWNTIIYLAVLVGLNPEHYEAAEVDGASRIQKMWYISIPGLMPTAILLLTMSVGWLISSGFESQFVLGNPVVYDYSDVLDLYALRYSTQLSDYSYGMAINMFKSVVSILLILSVTALSKKWNQNRLF
ncbi:ABC transporter permease [Paenibacillus xanthanilyticus]|uniref:ABC transporter permease n=1 Tax=Paenibacillus xanthanilyticus TaxID=1783531 RepID=A0ABV8JVQ3_9BACL